MPGLRPKRVGEVEVAGDVVRYLRISTPPPYIRMPGCSHMCFLIASLQLPGEAGTSLSPLFISGDIWAQRRSDLFSAVQLISDSALGTGLLISTVAESDPYEAFCSQHTMAVSFTGLRVEKGKGSDILRLPVATFVHSFLLWSVDIYGHVLKHFFSIWEGSINS